MNEKTKLFIKNHMTIIYLIVVAIMAVFMQPFDVLIQGLQMIFVSPGVLISDYIAIGGLGVAIFNASIVALIGCGIVTFNRLPYDGASVSAIFTMFGFGLFGKNIWSILPIIFGVYLYCLIKKVPFKKYLYVGLFGTALSPLVTQIAFGFGWGIIAGILFGILVGFILPSVALQALRIHQGYNLYNVGFTAGLVGFIFLSVFRFFQMNSEVVSIVSTEHQMFLRLFCIISFGLMIGIGFIFYEPNRPFKKLLLEPGQLRTDFIERHGFKNAWINMGLVGLLGVAYIELVGGAYSGPIVGGIFTMVAFATLGKHVLNCIPIMAGVFLATLIPNALFQASDTPALLAALFGTTLAPLAGRFGALIGIAAGFVHMTVVSQVGILHGGMNLYNNGFAGGFVAAIFVALVKGFYRKTDYLDLQVDDK